MPDSSTPASTPRARSCVATTTATVTSITTDEVGGWRRRLGIEFQLNVPIDTITMTATSAGIGMRPTTGPSTDSRNIRNAPATKVESRLRPPEVTLMTDCPIIAQPPMPPTSAAAMFAPPWPAHSRRLSLSVSVMSSTIWAVSSDSSSPTAAIVSEYGRMIRNVSSVSGTFGSDRLGNPSGSRPMSPTVRTGRPSAMLTAARTTIATSGDGTALVTRGSR